MADVKKIKIENSELKEKQIGKRYADVMLRGLRSGGAQGLTVGEMADIAELIKTIKEIKEDSVIELTAADLKTVIVKTQAIQWFAFSQEIVDMDKYLTSL